MDFNRAQQEYQRLKTLFGQGDLTAEEFEAACNEKLVVRDQFGCVWQIGVNSGKWYCFEKGIWTQKEPGGAATPAHHAVDVPETLQSVPKPAPILSVEPRSPDLGQPDDSEARPIPEAKLKSAQNRSKTQVRSTFSWLLLAGLVIVLLVGLSGLGLLLVREQRFGWNPRTPVRFGSPTPTRLSTRTPAVPTPTSQATRTAAPTDTPTPAPSRTFTAEPRYAPQVWQQTQAIYFTARPSVSEDWLTALDSAAAITFEDYNRLGAMKIQYSQDFMVFPSGDVDEKQEGDAAVQQEMVFAFPQPNASASLTMMCRTQDGKDGYSLRVTPFRWNLFKVVDGVETSLAEAATSMPLQQGNWTTLRLGCMDNQFTVWDETGLIATVEDSGLSQGRVAVRFENDSSELPGEIAVYFYRLLRLEQ